MKVSAKAGVKVHETPAKVVWFKGRMLCKDVLGVLEPVPI